MLKQCWSGNPPCLVQEILYSTCTIIIALAELQFCGLDYACIEVCAQVKPAGFGMDQQCELGYNIHVHVYEHVCIRTYCF